MWAPVVDRRTLAALSGMPCHRGVWVTRRLRPAAPRGSPLAGGLVAAGCDTGVCSGDGEVAARQGTICALFHQAMDKALWKSAHRIRAFRVASCWCVGDVACLLGEDPC